MLSGVIPTMLVIGLLLGRWAAVPLAGIGWAVLLLAVGVIGLDGVPAAFGVAVINAAVGVMVRQIARLAVRWRAS
jgi:hypothetical protein